MRQKRKGRNRKYVLIIPCNHSMKQTSKLKQTKKTQAKYCRRNVNMLSISLL